MVKINKPWVPFFFESNLFFGRINGMDDWNRMREAHLDKDDDQLLEAREATYNGTRSTSDMERNPHFGFRTECDGDRTLLDFFIINNMSLDE